MPVSHILLALVMAIVTSGFTSLVSHAATMMVPAVFTILILIIAFSRGVERTHVMWLLVPTLLIIVALLSTNHTNGTFPSLIHAIGMFAPLYVLSVSSRGIDRVMHTYIRFCAVFEIGMVGYLALHLDEIRAWRISGIAGCGNLVACQINMVLPFLFLYAARASGWERRTYQIFAGIGVCCVVLIMSRTGVAALLCSVFLLLLVNHRRIAIVGATLAVGLVLFHPESLYSDSVQETLRRFRLISYNPTYARQLIWTVAAEGWSEHPGLGVGPGNASTALGGVGVQVNHAHNNVLQVSLEMGSVAGLVILGFSLYAGYLGARLILGGRNDLLAGLPIVPYLIYSITASPIQHPEMTLLLVVCIVNARMRLADASTARMQTKPTATPWPSTGALAPAHAGAVRPQPGLHLRGG